MMTIERRGTGFLVKTRPSTTVKGVDAANSYEVRKAVEHYFDGEHRGNMPNCPFCRATRGRI